MEWSGGIRTTTSAAGSCRAEAAPLLGDALLAAMQLVGSCNLSWRSGHNHLLHLGPGIG